MLSPNKTKFRKQHRRRGSGFSGDTKGGNLLDFGQFGLKCLECKELTSRQIESARRVIAREMKRGGKIWIRVFPDKPISRSGAEKPMGAGKGSVEYYASVVRPGKIIFEIDGIKDDLALKALKLASHKLPMKCKVVDSNNL